MRTNLHNAVITSSKLNLLTRLNFTDDLFLWTGRLKLPYYLSLPRALGRAIAALRHASHHLCVESWNGSVDCSCAQLPAALLPCVCPQRPRTTGPIGRWDSRAWLLLALLGLAAAFAALTCHTWSHGLFFFFLQTRLVPQLFLRRGLCSKSSHKPRRNTRRYRTACEHAAWTCMRLWDKHCTGCVELDPAYRPLLLPLTTTLTPPYTSSARYILETWLDMELFTWWWIVCYWLPVWRLMEYFNLDLGTLNFQS